MKFSYKIKKKHFRFERFAISVRTGGLLPIEECRNFKNETDWKQLCIEGKNNSK